MAKYNGAHVATKLIRSAACSHDDRNPVAKSSHRKILFRLKVENERGPCWSSCSWCTPVLFICSLPPHPMGIVWSFRHRHFELRRRRDSYSGKHIGETLRKTHASHVQTVIRMSSYKPIPPVMSLFTSWGGRPRTARYGAPCRNYVFLKMLNHVRRGWHRHHHDVSFWWCRHYPVPTEEVEPKTCSLANQNAQSL